MENWKNRNLIHLDGNDKCIKLSKHFSVGFDTFMFRVKFITLFKKPKNGSSWSGGSMYWKTLSFKDKLFDKNHGLIKLFNCYYYYSKHPYHGVNTHNINICILPIRLHKYYDELENNTLNVSCSI